MQSNGMHFSQDRAVPVALQALEKILFHSVNVPPVEMNSEAAPGKTVIPTLLYPCEIP